MEVKTQQSELSSEISRLLRKHFGKGPESVYITIAQPFVIIYLRNFLSPMEEMLLEEDHTMTIEEIRDKMMRKLYDQLKENIQSVTGIPIKEFYYDWSFENSSGMMVAVGNDEINSTFYPFPNGDAIESLVDLVSAEAEKKPDSTYAHLLNERTLVVIREGFLVQIEKQLIEMGFEEALTLAKRKLEKSLLYEKKFQFETLLNAEVSDIFVSWDFSKNKSIIIFIFKPQKL